MQQHKDDSVQSAESTHSRDSVDRRWQYTSNCFRLTAGSTGPIVNTCTPQKFISALLGPWRRQTQAVVDRGQAAHCAVQSAFTVP
jgi:hypothetical protein